MTGRDRVPFPGQVPSPDFGTHEGLSPDTASAGEVQALVERGEGARAREVFESIVLRQQGRASAIAYHYLRDVAEADEAVQDAFVKAFTRIGSFDPRQSFEAWFTRVLINGCLDRQKARSRRERWLLPFGSRPDDAAERARDDSPSPEGILLADERRRQIAQAIKHLPERQRAVLILRHYGELSVRDVASATGLNEATVRVHLFRAIRKLRVLLQGLVNDQK
jgi:RNA polymerase sigma-70 factor (ECF subfamily)